MIDRVVFVLAHATAWPIHEGTWAARRPFRRIVPLCLGLLRRFHQQILLQCLTSRSRHFVTLSTQLWSASVASRLLWGNSCVGTFHIVPIALRWNLTPKPCNELMEMSKCVYEFLSLELTAFSLALPPQVLCGFWSLFALCDRVAFARFLDRVAHLVI